MAAGETRNLKNYGVTNNIERAYRFLLYRLLAIRINSQNGLSTKFGRQLDSIFTNDI